MARKVKDLNQRWLDRKEAAEILGIGVNAVPRVAERANIRTRRVPATDVGYWRADVLRVAEESGCLVDAS